MIRNVKDVTDLFDRRFGHALGRPLSLIRTLVWVIVGIYALGMVVPAPAVGPHHIKALRGQPVRDVILDKNDPRGWTGGLKDPHKFTIDWIGGSTIQSVDPEKPGFLPLDVINRVQTIDGKPLQVNMYLMEASRIFDLHAALGAALADKPDLVILDVNPLWVFNPNNIQEWSNLNPSALPGLISNPGNWPVLGSLYSPSDAALSLASSHLSAIRDRWSYSQKLTSEVERLAPNPAPPAAPVAGAPRPTGVKLIATMQSPYSFWNYYRLSQKKGPGLPGYPAIMRQAQTDGATLNDDIVAQMLSELGKSKIPSIAYMSAVDPATLKDPSTNAALHRVEARLQQIAAEHPARTLFVQPQSGTRLVTGLKFRDMAHMTDDAPMANLLAETVCAQLIAINPQTTCTATPRTDP